MVVPEAEIKDSIYTFKCGFITTLTEQDEVGASSTQNAFVIILSPR